MGFVNDFFDFLLYSVVMPLLKMAQMLLALLLMPFDGFSPVAQVLVVSVVAALIAWGLGGRFRNRGETKLHAEFRERVESLNHTAGIGDAVTEKVLRKGINDSADRVYEELIMDKFFHMGITYCAPMFTFLIWLDYTVFPAENLEKLTGSSAILTFESGLALSTATFYLFSFNLMLLSFKIIGLAFHKISGRRIQMKQPACSGQLSEKVP